MEISPAEDCVFVWSADNKTTTMHVEQGSVGSSHTLLSDIVRFKTCKGQADMLHANTNPRVDTVYNISTEETILLILPGDFTGCFVLVFIVSWGQWMALFTVWCVKVPRQMWWIHKRLPPPKQHSIFSFLCVKVCKKDARRQVGKKKP